MRFDMFYELAVPEFAGTTERDVYHHSLEEIALADRADRAARDHHPPR